MADPMSASPGEALRAAVQQRLAGVLEEVLGLIQTTVDQYESRLGQCRAREEESERLRGARALLLLTEATERPREEEKEHNDPIVKEEEPDPWSISEARTLPAEPAPGPKNTPPPTPATARPRPHEESHGKLTGNHKTESEDSDEECPICRQLERRQKEELETAVSADETSARPNDGEDTRTSSHKEQIAPQEFENMQVKCEEEDQEFADGATKPLDVERREEGERSPKDLSETATNQDRETASECGKTSSEAKDEAMESEKEVGSGLGDALTAAMDDSTLKTTRNDAPKENAQNSSPLLNSAEEEHSLKNEESEKSIESKRNDCSDGADQPLQDFSDREKTEEEQARKDLKRTAAAADPDEEIPSKCRKPSTETQEETAPSENVVGARFQKDSGDAMEQEIPNNVESDGLDARKSSPLSNSEERERPTIERNGKSTNADPKRLGNTSLEAENANAQDRAHCLKQKFVLNLPMVRLVPLKFVHVAVRNEAQLTNSSGRQKSPQRISQEKLKEKQLGSDDGQQNVVQNSESSHKSTSGNALEKPTSVAARSPESVKVPSTSSSPARVSQKQNGEKSSDLSSRKQQKRKAKTKARTELQNVSKEALEIASDVADDRVNNSSESSKSKEGDISKIKNGKAKHLTAVKPSVALEEQGTKSLTSSSKVGSLQNTEGNSQNSSDKNTLKARKPKGNEASASSESKKRIRPKSKTGHDCPECGTTFSLKGNLLKHLIVHREERPFSCSQCDATFKRKLNLKAHMSTHSEVKEFECPICKRKYTRKSNLGEHMKCHSEQKPFSCSICNRRFTSSSNLRRHTISHSGLRPFRCEVCGKSFGRRSILREHMVSHSREQPFACAVCRTRFARKSNLMKHMRLHDDDRRHKCPECGAAFSQKVHLSQHMFQHTGEKPFCCSVCGKGFTRKSYIRQHREMYCLGPAQEVDRAPEQGRAHVKTRSSAHDQDRAQEQGRAPVNMQSPSKDQDRAHIKTRSPAHEQDRTPVKMQSPSKDQGRAHIKTLSPAYIKTLSPAHDQERASVKMQSPSDDQDRAHIKTLSPAHNQDRASLKMQSPSHDRSHRQVKGAETQEGLNSSRTV